MIPSLAVEGHDIYNTSQNDASKLENEGACCRSKQWIDQPKSEDAPSWTPRQQSALDMDNGSFSHKPREASTIYEYEEGFADAGQQANKPLGAKSPEPHQFSRVYQLYPELYVDQQDGEPIEVDSREPRQLFRGYQFRYTSYDPLQSASKMGIFCPKPIRNYPTHKAILQPELFEDWYVDMSEAVFDHEEFSSELFGDWHLNMSEPICVHEALSPEHLSVSSKTSPSPPELRKSFPARHDTPYPEFGDDDKGDDESVEADSPTPPRPVLPKNFPTRHDTPYPEFGDDEKGDDDESTEADSPELGRLFSAFYLTLV